MKKTAASICFLLLVFVMISCMEKEGSVAAETAPVGAKARFDRAKQKYLTMKDEGRDVSQITPLIQPLRNAIQARDYDEADRLLTRVEKLLDEASVSSPAAGISTDMPGRSTPPNVNYNPVNISPHFGFGIEYAEEGLAKVYRPLGANWAKIPLVDWGRVEPNPPRNGVHTYEWKRLDGVVSEYQANGFNLLIVLKSRCKWGTEPIREERKGKAGYPSTPPKPEYWDDFALFVQSMVERYDNDGVDDMPGLRMPVRSYEIESEAQHSLFWQGTFEDYAKLLQVSYKAIKKADKDTKVVLTGFNFVDMFDDIPSMAEVERKINALPPQKRSFPLHSLSFIKQALTLNEYFDEVEFHYVNQYKGIYGQVDFIRSEMRRNGYDKPIWAGDAASAPFFVHDAYRFNPLMPKEQADRLYRQLGDRSNPEHRKTVDWYLNEQAKSIVKKFVLGMEVGLDGIMMGNTKDWIGYSLPNFVFQGMIDQGKQPRPAFLAYKTTIEKLKGYDTIQRLKFEGNVYAYRFTGKGKKPMYVAWAEGGSTTIKLEAPVKRVNLTQPPTLLDQKAPYTESASTENNVLTVKLDSVPMFIEAN